MNGGNCNASSWVNCGCSRKYRKRYSGCLYQVSDSIAPFFLSEVLAYEGRPFLAHIRRRAAPGRLAEVHSGSMGRRQTSSAAYYSNAKTKMLLLLLGLISGVSRFNPVLTSEFPTLTATYCLPFAE